MKSVVARRPFLIETVPNWTSEFPGMPRVSFCDGHWQALKACQCHPDIVVGRGVLLPNGLLSAHFLFFILHPSGFILCFMGRRGIEPRASCASGRRSCRAELAARELRFPVVVLVIAG